MGAAIGLLMMIIIALIIATKKGLEKFTTDGEWIMRHVDPAFGGGGLLIPVVRGLPPQQQNMMMMR